MEAAEARRELVALLQLAHSGELAASLAYAGHAASVRDPVERARIDAGYPEFVDDLIDMSEVEWEHEKFFREKFETHWLWRVFPSWDAPAPKEHIRAGVVATTTVA